MKSIPLWILLVLVRLSFANDPVSNVSGVYGLHSLDRGFKHIVDTNLVQVSHTLKPSKKFEMPAETFHQEQEWAKSVFMVNSQSGQERGTAFAVGEDLVLTAGHLFQSQSCGNFEILKPNGTHHAECVDVLFCGKRYDFCLVQTGKLKAPILSLQVIAPVSTETLTVIGNSEGSQLSASSGTQTVVENVHMLVHSIPNEHGASGAPILNSSGQVVGIHKGVETDSDRELGCLMSGLRLELERTKPEHLSKLNWL